MKREREHFADDGENRRRETPAAPSKLAHPFKANFNDHFETSMLALRDIYPFLDELRSLTRPSCPEAFTLYDPYYCTGKVKEAWQNVNEFGPVVPRVIHENRDFYEDVKNGIAPPLVVRDEEEGFIKDIGHKPAPFDVTVTNPPYSDNHIERFMSLFAIPSLKPWAMLVPDYIAQKYWYVKLVEDHFNPAPVVGRNVGFEQFGAKSSAASSKGPATASSHINNSKLPAGLRMAATIPRMIPMMIPFEEEKKETEALPVAEGSDAAVKKDVEGVPSSVVGNEKTDSGEENKEVGGEKKIAFADDEVTKASAPTPIIKYSQEPFYIIPKGRYEFDHPVQAGRDRSHFKSMWIVSGGSRTTELLKSLKARMDTSKVSIASGRVELIRQTAAPGTAGSVALIPNSNVNASKFNNRSFNNKQNHQQPNKKWNKK